jgi:peptidoglycan hydrolase-like protein with peptidoglycan-binding domain
MPRRLQLVGVASALTIAVGAVAWAASPAHAAARVSTATVVRRDLVERENVNGTLGYGTAADVNAPRSGTLTRLPAAGSVVERGQSLFDVDALPVPLLYGDVPLYRDLESGVSDGADVRQLEENLTALGYGDSLTVDEHFDRATTAAVNAWQYDLGVEKTGAVRTTDAVVASGAQRVSEVRTRVGARIGPGTPVISATATTPLVTVRLEVSRRSLATAGAKAKVVLPDGTEVDGTVVNVGTVATKDSEQSAAKIDVSVTVDDPAKASGWSEAPVTVRLTRATASNVLTVPVRALLALSEGGYAVEIVRGTRAHRLVGVELGAFADGSVAITGRVRPGDRVVVAA